MTRLDLVLSRFPDARKTNAGWEARCPAHDDRRASLTITQGDDGRVLLHCHAGCTANAIVTAVGLALRDLFPQDRRPERPAPSTSSRRIAEAYDYCDEHGELLFQVVRFDPKDFRQRRPDGHGGWTWKLEGVRRVLYRLRAVLEADAATPVFVVEGEKDVHALEHLGLVATTNPGGAGKWRPEYNGSLRGRHVFILPDNDKTGRDHADDIRRHLAGVAASVRIVELPDLPPKGDVSDWIAAGGTRAALETIVADTARLTAVPPNETRTTSAQAMRENTDTPTQAATAPGRAAGASAADALVRLGRELLELWHDPDGEPYASLVVGDHVEHHALRARAVRSYLAGAFYKRTQRSARSDAMTEALGTLEGLARYEGDEHRVAVRLGEHEGAIYLDLGDALWRAVEITPGGWRVVERAPVRFRRSRGLRSLPMPVVGGSIEELRSVLPAVDDDDWCRLVAWLLAALRPVGPYPVLCLHGEAGAAKSTTARIVRSLVDPALAPLRSAPRDERDLVIAASNSHVVALDNLSHVPPWLSDALCRLATGGGYATRTLYTDAEETVLDVQRPVILTGIEELAVRGDLADRGLVATLPTIADEQRISEAALTARVAMMRPRVLGALLAAVACGLRQLPHTHLERLPRLADAALWWAACEPALLWPAGRILAAHDRGRTEAAATTLEASVVGAALLPLLAAQGQYEGTAGELLELLGKYTSEAIVRDRNRWPQSARGLAGALRRLAPALRRAGWSVEWPPRRGSGRPVTIRHATVTTVTTVIKPADAGLGGDGPGDDAARPSLQPSPEKSNDAAAHDAGDRRDGHAATSRELRI